MMKSLGLHCPRFGPDLFVRIVSVATVVVGSFVLLGWARDVTMLNSVLPGLATMKPNTAFAFVLAGVALWLLRSEQASYRAMLSAQACALVVVSIGLLTLIQYLFQVDLGIDTLLVNSSNLGLDSVRMAPATAFEFLLLGAALLVLDRPGRTWMLSQSLTFAVVLISLLNLIGYLYGVQEFYRIRPFVSVSLYTAVTFFLLGHGVLLTRPRRGVVGLMLSPTLGGLVIRRQFPAFVFFLILFGLLRVAGQEAGWFDTAFGAALMVVSSTIVFGILIGWTGWELHHVDLKRQHAERVSREQAELLSVTLTSIGDAIVTTDASGRITFLNAVAQSLTGWSNQEAKGLPLETVFRIINQQTRQPVDSPANRALREGCIVGLANHTILIAKDGTEWAIDDSAAPIKNERGTVIGAVMVFRDVTEKRRVVDALRQSEQRLRFVMDSMPQKIFTAQPNGDVDYFNPIWMEFTGLPFEQIRDWGWTRFIHPDDLDENVRAWKHSVATGEPFQFEHRFQRADGEYRWHISRAVPMRDDEGRVVMWIGSNTDIHDVKAGQEALKEADRRKDEFLATLAHELRNPLAPIRNGLQIMRLCNDSRESVAQARTMMERQLGQMVRLVDDLLDVSRISRGKLQLRTERVELNAVLHSAIETSRPLIDAHGHELLVTLPSTPIYLEADLTRLAQVFANLLNNAAKYTERGGTIQLTAELVDQNGSDSRPEALVTIKDTGMGIPPHMLPSIFDMFIQVDRSLDRAQGGLGIGLTLARRLVEMHGGSIEAKSDGPGRGSEFTVRVPVDVLSHPSPELPTEEHKTIRRSGHCCILVADDNTDSASSLSLMLRLMGNEVHTANDGLEAVEMAETLRLDLILLDIGMPKLDGYQACRRIRERSWGQNVIIVALTGWGQDEDKRRSQEAGFDHHIVKPVDPATLEQLLSGLHRCHPAARTSAI